MDATVDSRPGLQPQPHPTALPSASAAYFSRTTLRTSSDALSSTDPPPPQQPPVVTFASFTAPCSFTTLSSGGSQRRDQLLEPRERGGFDAVTDARAVDFTLHEPRVLQRLEVLRHGRLRQRQLVDQHAAVALTLRRQQPDDRHPRRMADRPSEARGLAVGGRGIRATNLRTTC